MLWSTAYLDEAERCAEVCRAARGPLLARAGPRSSERGRAGRTFLVAAPGAAQARAAGAAARRQPGIVDALIQGERVRMVTTRRPRARPRALLPGVPDVTRRAVRAALRGQLRRPAARRQRRRRTGREPADAATPQRRARASGRATAP